MPDENSFNRKCGGKAFFSIITARACDTRVLTVTNTQLCFLCVVVNIITQPLTVVLFIDCALEEKRDFLP